MTQKGDRKVTKEILEARIRSLESQLLNLKLDLREYVARGETAVEQSRIIYTDAQGGETTEERIKVSDRVVVLNPNPGQPKEGEVIHYNPETGYATVKGEGFRKPIRRFLKNLRRKNVGLSRR